MNEAADRRVDWFRLESEEIQFIIKMRGEDPRGRRTKYILQSRKCVYKIKSKTANKISQTDRLQTTGASGGGDGKLKGVALEAYYISCSPRWIMIIFSSRPRFSLLPDTVHCCICIFAAWDGSNLVAISQRRSQKGRQRSSGSFGACVNQVKCSSHDRYSALNDNQSSHCCV